MVAFAWWLHDKTIEQKAGYHTLPVSLKNTGIDAKNIFTVQSIMNLPWNLQLDVVYRYVDELPSSQFTSTVPAYSAFDVRVAWHSEHIALSVNAQNIGRDKDVEFGTIRIPQNLFVKGVVRF